MFSQYCSAGISWWISDTGGFYGGNIHDPLFRELLVRWYEWAVFMPVLRMHGDRQPNIGALAHDVDHGGGFCSSGSPNELWSYGEEVYEILRHWLDIRLSLRPYIKKTADETVETGLPMMRALYLAFPDDPVCWTIGDEYLFGSDYLVAPVTEAGARQREVYLPAGTWEPFEGGDPIESTGMRITADAPLAQMPVFKRIR